MGATTITTNGRCADIKEGSQETDKEYSSKANGKEKDMQEM